MRRLARGSVWLGLGLLVTACAILQAREFDQAVDHLSQAEVVVRWGLPESVVAGTEGQTLWIYTVRAHVWAQPAGILVTSPGWVVPGGWRCTEYLFRFDRTQVFRGWTARRCQRGEKGHQVVTGGARYRETSGNTADFDGRPVQSALVNIGVSANHVHGFGRVILQNWLQPSHITAGWLSAPLNPPG